MKRVVTRAEPIPFAICWMALSDPLAEPASSGRRLPRAVLNTELKQMPAAIPMMLVARTFCHQVTPRPEVRTLTSRTPVPRIVASIPSSDTGPASLYVYVRNVTVLHALLVDRLLADLDLDWDGVEPWRDRLHRAMGDYVDLLARQGELARAVMFVWPDGPNYLDLIELLLRLLRAAGDDETATAWGIDLLLQHAGSTAAEWAARSSGTGQEVDDLDATLAASDPERHPTLAAFPAAAFTRGTHVERREWALDTIIDGLVSSRR